MSITRFTSCLFAMMMSLVLAASASAQRVQPFIDPDYFNPDLQFFAPAEIYEYGGEPQAKTGFFADYNRLYIYVTRPQQEATSTQMDHTWGNLFDLGYMTKEDHGWLFSVWHVDGPQANDYQAIQRIAYAATPQAAAGGGAGGAGAAAAAALAIHPSTNRNDSETRERVFNQYNSLNVADMTSFEINKTFRLEPLHNGGYLEPFLGARYVKFIDFTERDSYARYDATGVIVPNIPAAATIPVVEQLTEDRYMTVNNMFGGQLGLRSFVQRSQWTLSNEVRFFALQNFQDFSRQTDNQFQGDPLPANAGGAAGGGGGAVGVSNYTATRTREYDHGSEFVWGGEVRVNAAYQLTRDIGLKFGFNFVEFADGIGRGMNFRRNSEDVTMAGVNFGVTINR